MKKLILSVALLLACVSHAYGMGADINALRGEIESLHAENKKLSDEIQLLNNVVKNLNDFQDKRIAALEDNFPRTAYIEPSSDKYAIVSCTGGLFAVFCKDVKKYSTGSELTIMFVNMLGTTSQNLNMKICYSNAIFEAGDSESFSSYIKGKKEVIEKVDGLFPPGTAKYKKIRIPEYQPDQLAILEISISVDGINYRP